MLNHARNLLKMTLPLLLTALLGCYPALKREARMPEEALVPVHFFYPTFQDDLDTESLVLAVKTNLIYLERLDPQKVFHYGPHDFTCEQVRESQKFFLGLIRANPDPGQLNKEIGRHFQVYRAAGRSGNNKVLFTGYYEPIFDARLRPDHTFKYPLYNKPRDLLSIDLSLFRNDLQDQSIFARIDRDRVVPYYSRYEIEVKKALQGRKLEIAWLKDPVDVTLLHIQGSGRLRLPEGKTISVSYQASNGRPYQSIGRYMLERKLLSRDELSMQSIRAYLAAHPEVREEVLNYNPSYVFFRILQNGPLGNINIPITPGRTLALDNLLFPKGALAFISCEKPLVNSEGRITGWTRFSRFVLNQDTGGAIKGAGRADLFWGSGLYAEVAAGHMKHDGDLYVLIKKPSKE
jgi:membrane-bound lytic murein transglycosylase A